jgi:hypothetical protein
MRQNIQSGTYITIRVLKLTKEYITNKNYIIYKIKEKHTKHTTIYTMIQNRTRIMWKKTYGKRNSHINTKSDLLTLTKLQSGGRT